MGYNLAQVQGKHHRMFCTPELANSSAYSDFWRRLNQGELFNGQFERIDKNGQVVWLEANYNPVYDASGRLCKVVKYASDVTAMVEKAWRVSVWIISIIDEISAVEPLVRAANCRTSSATTAKPRPCSPARAASMAAFNASRLVWSAIPRMVLTMASDRVLHVPGRGLGL